MTGRDLATSAIMGGGFLAAALAFVPLVPTQRSSSVFTALLLVVAYALVSRVEFEIGAGSAVPTQLLLVPMLFVLPLAWVPLCVGAGLVLAGAIDSARQRTHPERLLVPLCSSWHAIGPVLVFALAGEREPSWGDWPLYLAALGAQFLFDLTSSTLRDRLVHGVPPLQIVRFLLWVFVVDSLLAPAALLTAFAAAAFSFAWMLALPLIALLAIFGRERHLRIDRTVELGSAYRETGVLAEVFHDVLAEQNLDTLLDRIADTLAELIPHDALVIFEADEAQQILVPALARGALSEQMLAARLRFGEGITGWVAAKRQPVLTNAAHLDPRVKTVPGTPADDPEALIAVPLVARGSLKGALNVYRLSADAAFTESELRLVGWFGDAAALAIDNAQIRAGLELQAQTDSLTGLYNHRYFHERLRTELTLASRAHESVALLMLDIDDFKRVNDVHGHCAGDQVLVELADLLRRSVRARDVACRTGGEEFSVIMTACDAGEAVALARRLASEIESLDFEPVGAITVSVGVAQGPEHGMNPRELVACSEAAMMTAKSHGKNAVVLFDQRTSERPVGTGLSRRHEDVRSSAHLKMLQSLAGKLSRLNDVRRIGETIVNELRTLIDYHSCRVYLAEGQILEPIAFGGAAIGPYADESADALRTRFGEGITGRAAERGESLLIADSERCEFAVQIPGTERIDESMLAVPLLYGSRAIGVVVISKLGLSQFDLDDVRLLEVLAGHASVALENARLYESQRREAADARTLLELSSELAKAEGLEAVIQPVVEFTARILQCPEATVSVADESGELVAHAVWGDGTRQLGEPPTPPQLAAPSRPFLIGDAAVAPLALEGGRHGWIAAFGGEVQLGERELELLAGIASQAKLAIASAGSFESLETTFLSTVEALASALETNDAYTSSHARAITDLALAVGRELELGTAALKRLELGALFHDIGKIGVPSQILGKPGPLTAEELAVMKLHPELGERILAPIKRLAEVRPIVRHCHERWDGTGYPDGRAGTEIPLESRIIFVCDAFHAMTTDRPYRRRLSNAQACEELRAGAGTQFDPAVVDVFLRLVATAPAEPSISLVA